MVARFKKTVAFGFSKVWGHFGVFFTLSVSLISIFVALVFGWYFAALLWEKTLLTNLRTLYSAIISVTGDFAGAIDAVRVFATEAFGAGQEVYIFLLALGVVIVYFIDQIWTYLLIKLHLDVYHKDKDISALSVKGKWTHFWRFIFAKVVYNLAMIALVAVSVAGGYFIIQWPWAMVENSGIRFLLLLAGLCWVTGMVCLFITARVRLRYFSYIILDTNMGVIESMSTSVRITQGNFGYVLGYSVFYYLLYTIGHWVLAFFFFTPAAIGSDVYAYHSLMDQKKKK